MFSTFNFDPVGSLGHSVSRDATHEGWRHDSYLRPGESRRRRGAGALREPANALIRPGLAAVIREGPYCCSLRSDREPTRCYD